MRSRRSDSSIPASAPTASTPAATARKLYVSNRGSNKIHGPPHGPGSVSVIDFATRKVVAHLADSRRRQPRHGQRQRGRQARCGCRVASTTSSTTFDTTTGAVNKIPVGHGAARPCGLAAAGTLFAGPHRQHALDPGQDDARCGAMGATVARGDGLRATSPAAATCRRQRRATTSSPPMYERSAAGTSIEPSARW